VAKNLLNIVDAGALLSHARRTSLGAQNSIIPQNIAWPIDMHDTGRCTAR
jgi:hypothetical protein